MRAEELVQIVRQLDARAQARLYSELAYQLTIAARTAYERADAVAILRGINELQHRLFQDIERLREDDPTRFPDEEKAQGIFRFAGVLGVAAELSLALDHVGSKLRLRPVE